MKIPLSSVTLSELERRYVLDALDAGAVSSSALAVGAFERAIAAATGRREAVATNSGTSALELTLQALGCGPGDEVVVPALSFASPALVVQRLGARPVFADVDDTWTLDPTDAARVLSPRTKAIVAVDVFGHPCNYDALAELGVPVVEDAAEAFGAAYRDRPVGAFGVAAIFSLHANKVVSSGEGGCIVLDGPELADRLRQLNAFGMAPERRYWHTDPGCNFRMSGLVAALALAQLERADALIDGRRRVAAAYDAALAGLPLQRRPVADWARESVWLYTLAARDRAAVLESCRAHGVDARAVWPALPENPVFRPLGPRPCPRARALAAQAFWLPTWADMGAEDCAAVVAAVAAACVDEVG